MPTLLLHAAMPSRRTGSWAAVMIRCCPSYRSRLNGIRQPLLLLLLLRFCLHPGSVHGHNGTWTETSDAGMSSSIPPPVVVTTTASQCSQGEPMDMAPRSDWCCDCWNGHESDDVELQCRCMGQSLQRVPQKLPAAMHRLTVVQGNLLKLRYIGLQRYAGTLRDIMLADVPLFETIESGALGQCRELRTLYISQAPMLTHLPHDVFEGVPDTFRSLRIINCGLQHVPDMTYLSTHVILHMVDLEGNQIVRVSSHSVRIKTEQLILDNNPIEFVDQLAFYGSEIAKISLKGNVRLSSIHPAAFAGIVHVQEIDLSNTALQSLPTEGLGSLEILRIQNTHTLRTIPSVYHFKNLRVAWLTHPFHCCAFKFPSRHDPQRYHQRQQYLAQLKRTCIDNGLIPAANGTQASIDDGLGNGTLDGERTNEWSSWARLKRSFWNSLAGIAGDPRGFDPQEKHTADGHFFGGFNDDTLVNAITGKPFVGNGADDAGDFGDTFEFPAPDGSMDFGVFHESEADINPNSVLKATCGNLSQNDIVLECYPKPDALNPCEDVMGAQWLRISVWVVVFLAVVGNVAVLLVLFSSCKDVTVTKFLMSNLAFADLCLGLYLLLIAAIDLHSIGEYFNYGYDWQYGVGCQAAGFLSVFASHLSVFTLCIITLERWFAIRFAMQLNKRIKLRSALLIMLGGWTYSIVMSALPLFGISNYSSTSICLPMEARDVADVVYLVMIISNSGLAFCFIAICYAQIYMSLGKDTRQAHRNESRTEMTVAKKMALLVFTNFACWAPIAFFGLTALAGSPFIDVAKSKILLVFFYPLNSCADPYLYAILTAQYRRDLFMMLGRCGLCKGKARAYNNNNNSLPMLTTQTLLTRRSSSMERSASSRKASRDLIMRREEEFV